MPDVLLGIETSCDETSAAVLTRQGEVPELASLVILTQDVHRIFDGVVPELASRAHLQTIGRVVERALDQAGLPLGAVDSIAVTAGPGLVGALLVGVCYAKGLAATGGRELIGVHHLEGHLFAPLFEHPDLRPPFVALVVSGGHTVLLDVPDWGEYRLLGQTRDDAAGEAFDKVARMLDLGYPGGPEVEKLAREGTPRFALPRPMLNKGFDFSFSGLKTAVLYTLRDSDTPKADRADLASSFQEAVFDVLAQKVTSALDSTGYETVVLGGGVACSQSLIARMTAALNNRAHLAVASPRLNADNAAMVARCGWYHLMHGRADDLTLDASATMPWPGLVSPPSDSKVFS